MHILRKLRALTPFIAAFLLCAPTVRATIVTAESPVITLDTRDLVNLTINATNGTVAGAGQYVLNTSVQLTPVPAPGYAFTGWSGAATGNANPLTVVMDGDKTITANFTLQYTLTTSALSNGSISGIAAGGLYLTGTDATLTAVPAAGYVFTGWTGAATGTANPLTLTMDGDKMIGATFTREYTLTTSALSNGSITGIAAGGKYLTGTGATLTAVPAAGYVFTGWTGAASGTANPLILTMDSDKTIGATFTREYTLTASAVSNGSITGIAAGGKYLTGASATLTAVPAAGYVFTGWTGAATGTANPLTLTMDGDKMIGATFTREYTLTTSALSNGSITGMAPGGKYLTGSIATLTAVPAAGYVFTGWTGAATGSANPLDLTMDGNKTIGATFTRQYTLTTSTLSNGSISGIPADGKYLTGSTATLTAVPAAGYVFTGWTGAASGTTNPLNLLIDSDKMIGANFMSAAEMDADGDGLSAALEVFYGTDPTKADTDSDGLSDGREVGLGRFSIVSGTFTWDQARADAHARSGELASFPSQAAWDRALESLGTDALLGRNALWIGATDSTTEGVWSWVNGAPFSFNQWHVGRPFSTPGNNFDYAAVSGENYDVMGEWYDLANTTGTSDGYILETGHATDPTVADLDGDGLNDGAEQTAGSNPFVADTDGDGLTDGQEVNLAHTDPLKADSNANGINDGQEDFDLDGLNNLLEAATYGTDPLNADTDSDGLTDGWEVGLGRFSIISGSFTWQQARDDAHARSGELASFPTQNAWDRALESLGVNPLGNNAELWIGASDAATEGVWTWTNSASFGFSNWVPGRPRANHSLNFATVSGAYGPSLVVGQWYDRSSTTTVDGYILEMGHASDPKVADNANAIVDTDGDGFSDAFETSIGSNPLSASSTPEGHPALLAAPLAVPPSVNFSFNAANGVSYRIESSTDCASWTLLETDIIGKSDVVTRSYPIAGLPARFFRVRRN